jgi:cytoskeleton protein RodZ
MYQTDKDMDDDSKNTEFDTDRFKFNDVDDDFKNTEFDTDRFKFDADGNLLREHSVPTDKTWQAGSLGTRLRATRESQRISIDEVCDRLYLERFIVEGLESDDYNGLPPRAFVQGYVRSYAKFLNIPQETALQCYREQEGGGEDAVQINYNLPTDIPEAEATSKDPKFKLLSFILAVAVLIGLGLWWSDNNFSLPDLNSATQEEETTAANEQDSAIDPNSLLPVNPDSLNTDAPMQNIVQPAVNDVADYQPPGEEADTPTDATEQAPDNTEADATQTDAASAAVDAEVTTPEATDTDTESTSASTATAAAPASTAAVVIRAEGDCWTEVTDGDGNKLMTGMLNGGDVREFDGQAPFKIKLGRPQAVTLEYRGEVVDLSRYANSIARLTLE